METLNINKKSMEFRTERYLFNKEFVPAQNIEINGNYIKIDNLDNEQLSKLSSFNKIHVNNWNIWKAKKEYYNN